MVIRLGLFDADPRVVWPVVAADGLDVVLYDDVTAVAGVEAPDLESLTIFDAAGPPIDVEVLPGSARIRVRGEAVPEQLAALLRGYLREIGSAVGSDTTLADLIEMCRSASRRSRPR